jgi:hypothetical protein
MSEVEDLRAEVAALTEPVARRHTALVAEMRRRNTLLAEKEHARNADLKPEDRRPFYRWSLDAMATPFEMELFATFGVSDDQQ